MSDTTTRTTCAIMDGREITLTANVPGGFAVAHAGRHYIEGNRAPYFTAGVDVYASRRAWEIGAEAREYHGAGGDGLIASHFPVLAPIAAMHGASSTDGSPSHGAANGWYYLSGGSAAWVVKHREHPVASLRRDPTYGREPDHVATDLPSPDGYYCPECGGTEDTGHRRDCARRTLSAEFMAHQLETAARALRVSVEDLPNVQDPALFEAWVEDFARPRWQDEADQACALIDRLVETCEPVSEPSRLSESTCSFTVGKAEHRVSVRAVYDPSRCRMPWDGEGVRNVYRVIVRAAGTSYTTLYGGSTADYQAGHHDARGACNCVLRELMDALNYSSGAEWADEMGSDPEDAGYKRMMAALDRCIAAAERMRSALEANRNLIGG